MGIFSIRSFISNPVFSFGTVPFRWFSCFFSMKNNTFLSNQNEIEWVVIYFDEKPVRTGSDTPWKENNMKIAIVTDSNSGITQSQAGELGNLRKLPMPFDQWEKPLRKISI